MHHLLIMLSQICDTILKQIHSFVKRSTRLFPCRLIRWIKTIFLLRMNPIKTFLFKKSNLSWSLGMHSGRCLPMWSKRCISNTLDKILIGEKRLMQYFIFRCPYMGCACSYPIKEKNLQPALDYEKEIERRNNSISRPINHAKI